MAYPEQDAERLFQTVIIAVAFVIGSLVTLLITSPSILDTNTTSYIIVTMLMGILFILFTLKDPTPMETGDYGIVVASVAFIIYLIFVSYARVTLSFGFLSYRIDALLLPLLLFSIVSAVSGLKGVKRFLPVIVYLFFASSVLLMPLLVSNGLSSFSAGIVFFILKSAGAHVVQSGLQILSASDQSISIASAGVPVGTFVALVMLLLPVAYLYEGSPDRKIYWIICGVLLLFALNIVRMSAIALLWAQRGLSGSAVSTIHAFAGALIFYLTMVVMLLAYGKFGLKLKLGDKWAKRLRSAFGAYDIEESYGKVFAAMLIAVAVLLLSLGLLNSPSVSAASFNQAYISNSTYPQLYQSVISRINASGVGYSFLGANRSTMLFEIGRAPAANSTYLVVNLYPYLEKGGNTVSYSYISSSASYALRSGISVTSLVAISENTTFFVDYFAVPITVNGSAYSANFEAFAPVEGANASTYCNPSLSSGLSDYLESGIYNLLHGQPGLPELCAAERIALT